MCSCNCPSDLRALEILLSSLAISRSRSALTMGAFTALVVVGVVIEFILVGYEISEAKEEYTEDLAEWESGHCPRPRKLNVRLKVAEVTAAGLVALGVAGELWCEQRIRCIDNQIQQAEDVRANLLELEAGAASQSAIAAAGAAGIAQASADAANFALAQVRTKVSGINEAMANRTPRAILLLAASSDVAKELRPFRGQKFSIRICGSWSSNSEVFQDPNKKEMSDVLLVTDAILVTPSTESAEWVNPSIRFGWDKCPNVGDSDKTGVDIWVSADASPKTKRAAEALSEALNSVLPPQPRPMLSPFKPDSREDDKYAPWAEVSNDPGLISVIVRRPPMQFIFGQEKRKKSAHK